MPDFTEATSSPAGRTGCTTVPRYRLWRITTAPRARFPVRSARFAIPSTSTSSTISAPPATDVVWGLGYRTSGDETHPTTLLFFDPASKRLGLFNVFAQDEIAIRDDRLHLILGSKFENYTYSGW